MCFLLGLSALCVVGSSQPLAKTADRIVAIVNDEIVTKTDIDEFLTQLSEGIQGKTHVDAKNPKQRRKALQHLIEQHLILQEAKALDVKVESADVAARLRKLQDDIGSLEDFQRALRQSGMSEAKLRTQIRERLMVQRLIDAQIRATITVSPYEIAQAIGGGGGIDSDPGIERVRMHHILIRVNESRSEKQAQELIETIREQLSRGGDFSKLARKYSEDPSTEDGGRLDWVNTNELLPELRLAVQDLEPGKLSGPIKSRLGFHLIRIDERAKDIGEATKEAKDRAYRKIFQRKFDKAFARWIEGLKGKAYIEVLAEP